MKKILFILTLAFVVLAGCDKESVPGSDSDITPDAPATIMFTTNKALDEQITLGFDKGDYSQIEVTGAVYINHTVGPDYISADYYLGSKGVTITGAVTYFDCHGNDITNLVVIGQTKLKTLDCHNNSLTSLDLAGCGALEKVACYDNRLTSLDIRGCGSLKRVACYDNPIKGEAVASLINALPNRSNTTLGKLWVKGTSEVRKVTVGNINIATSKNWQLLESNNLPTVPVYELGDAQPQSLGTPANCYIVSEAGVYSFKTEIGKTGEPVEDIAYAEVLWETYGTDEDIRGGDLIPYVSYEDGNITFATVETYRTGNAVIAAKDTDGNLLWCWHIWMTALPGTEFVTEKITYARRYYVMDRNVGATSTYILDPNCFGLYYYKNSPHPFIGPRSVTNPNFAKGTVDWVEFRAENPTYGSVPDNNSKKAVDPCPAGYKIMEDKTVHWMMDRDALPHHGVLDWYSWYDSNVSGRCYFPFGGSGILDNGTYGGVGDVVTMIVLDYYTGAQETIQFEDFRNYDPISSNKGGYVRCAKY